MKKLSNKKSLLQTIKNKGRCNTWGGCSYCSYSFGQDVNMVPVDGIKSKQRGLRCSLTNSYSCEAVYEAAVEEYLRRNYDKSFLVEELV